MKSFLFPRLLPSTFVGGSLFVAIASGLLWAGALLVSVPSAFAKSPEVYVVDVNRVLEESIVGKGARNDLEEQARQAQTVIEGEKRALAVLREKIQKQATLLSPDALEGKAASFRKKETELARKARDEKEQLDRNRAKVIARIVKDIDVIIESMAKEKDYPVILERDPRVVVYVGERFDITSDVIEELDKRRTSL